MKRTTMVSLAAAALCLMGAGWGRGGDDKLYERKKMRRAAPSAPAVVHKMRRVAVPRPGPALNREQIPRRRAIEFPRRDASGAAINQPASSAPPSHHAAVARSQAFMRGIQARQNVEVVPRRTYWHNDGGVRYAHFFDGREHWYGFYHGPTFYWTRFYGNRWWWFDARFGGRWVYWWDGFWWWPGPGGALYMYVDNGYYPYSPEGVTVVTQESDEAPAVPPTAKAAVSASSPDGRRMVQIIGADDEAYLYDKTGAAPAYLKFLGRGAEKARFSASADGSAPQILIEFKDGTFALYDMDGNPQNAAVKAAPPASQPPPPEEVPPPPTSAPGQ